MDAKKKFPSDLNQLAKLIVDTATSENPLESSTENPPSEKKPAAVALGRLGGKKGGRARAAKLTQNKEKKSQKRPQMHGGKKQSSIATKYIPH